MKLAITMILLLGICCAQSAPKPANLELARVTCKTCAVIVKKSGSHRLRYIALAALPVAVFAVAEAFTNSPPPPASQKVEFFVPIRSNPAFCIVGQTC